MELPAFRSDTAFIEKYGGKADAVTLNTTAIQHAIDALSAGGGGVVYIGPGQWITGPIVLKSNVNLHIARGGLLQFSSDFDQYPLVTTNYEGLGAARCQSPISAKGQSHIAITGKGIIDGAGDAWRMVKKDKLTASQWNDLVASGGVVDSKGRIWYPSEGSLKGSTTKDAGVLKEGRTTADFKDIKDYLRPNLLSLVNCKDVLLEGVTFQNSPAWCLHPLLCERMIIRDIYAKNPWYAQNGDGLDLESCKDVLIEKSSFDVGDDGICMKSGRDEQGRKRGAPTQNVLIQYCTVYHAHGGFVIGSEMSGGVKNVGIRYATFLGTDIGLRFKTTRGRGGIVENIYASHINMNSIKGDAIRFDMYYAAKDPIALNGEKRDTPKEVLLPVTEATPQFRNFYIQYINCQGAEHSLFFRGLPEMAIKDIHLRELTMQTHKGIELIQADGIQIRDMHAILTGGQGPAVRLNHATHLSLRNVKMESRASEGISEAGWIVSGHGNGPISLENCTINGRQATKSDFKLISGAETTSIQIKP
ncbi:glycoside hydrolase family 28 protein [Arachidicoccus terrestris]|nr:glycoside hydrolase family 28 protein [Arachidicoccus terrestris]